MQRCHPISSDHFYHFNLRWMAWEIITANFLCRVLRCYWFDCLFFAALIFLFRVRFWQWSKRRERTAKVPTQTRNCMNPSISMNGIMLNHAKKKGIRTKDQLGSQHRLPQWGHACTMSYPDSLWGDTLSTYCSHSSTFSRHIWQYGWSGRGFASTIWLYLVRSVLTFLLITQTVLLKVPQVPKRIGPFGLNRNPPPGIKQPNCTGLFDLDHKGFLPVRSPAFPIWRFLVSEWDSPSWFFLNKGPAACRLVSFSCWSPHQHLIAFALFFDWWVPAIVLAGAIVMPPSIAGITCSSNHLGINTT